MKLLTKKIEAELESSELCGNQDSKVIVKFFNPCGSGTWLITGGKKIQNDWILYGYCHIYEWEWGTVSLKELESIRTRFGLGIERDMYANGKVKELV